MHVWGEVSVGQHLSGYHDSTHSAGVTGGAGHTLTRGHVITGSVVTLLLCTNESLTY